MIEPGTHVRMMSPSGRSYGEVVFRETGEEPMVVGDAEGMKVTFGMAALYLWVLAKDKETEVPCSQFPVPGSAEGRLGL